MQAVEAVAEQLKGLVLEVEVQVAVALEVILV
jgi:hypothetical protein